MIYTVYTTKLVNKAFLPSTQNYHQLVPVLPFALPCLLHWDPPTNSARIKGALSGSSRSQELEKNVQQQYSGDFCFSCLFCIHEWILIFPLQPFQSFKREHQRLDRSDLKIDEEFHRWKSPYSGRLHPVWQPKKKNMPLSGWTRAFGWELKSYRRSTKPNPWLPWDNSDSTGVFFFRPSTVVAPMDQFSSQLVWCHSSSLISHMNGGPTGVYFCRNFGEKMPPKSYHPIILLQLNPKNKKNAIHSSVWTKAMFRSFCRAWIVTSVVMRITPSIPSVTGFLTHIPVGYIAKLSTTHALKRTSSDLKTQRSCLRSFPIFQLWIQGGFCKSHDATSIQNCPKNQRFNLHSPTQMTTLTFFDEALPANFDPDPATKKIFKKYLKKNIGRLKRLVLHNTNKLSRSIENKQTFCVDLL